MTTLYAYVQRHDPTTGEPIMDANRRAESPAPQTERALMALRTPLGTCLVDPAFGVDWQRINKLGTGAAATAKAVITAALNFLVADGSITGLTVVCEVDVRQGRLLYDVSFSDPRLDRRSRIQGEV